ncbi:ABC transporter [Dendrothele bispora CBS 962.96]|uniref:ABC transporter n=1 Tax=Dendrothele bispora (strain CBS 962.96) TaxID=1314807 RepID=A0A4S8MIW1_DENBC|nr:ABC transporter [Dendrothele bispora CBS 962.96]
MWTFVLPVASLTLSLVSAQSSCENYGVVNGSTCSCPTGFGGSTCSELGCGGNLFQGSQRPLTSTQSGFANFTASDCSCQSEWTGTGCNVCQSANACQSAFSSVSSGSSSGAIPGIVDNGTNSTMVCNNAPRVYASGQMSCSVNNPTLQAIYPGTSVLNIIRTLDPSLSPIPNVTSFGSSGTAWAQLFYDGEEQFYCGAGDCTQDSSSSDGSSKYSCTSLQCTCRANTTFCGAVRVSDLTNTINALTGPLDINCDAPDPNTNQATCHFVQGTLQQLFGSSGLTLNGCSFGECVRQNVIDTAGSNSTSAVTDQKSSLSGGVIAGLAVVGSLIFLALMFLAFGVWRQRKARLQEYSRLGGGGVAVEWKNVSYIVAGSDTWGRRRSKNVNDDKVILDSVSGLVLPGQMMAILGPSGAGKTTLVEILSGRHKAGNVTGVVSFPSHSSLTTRKPRIGFVPQQDILPPMLTVQEALMFAANLRLPEGVPEAEKQTRVNALMQKLGIEHLRNTRIGDSSGRKARGISGGEMRRVSIGLELIASPDVLILDEPTSGLDSVSAARVANVLHSIAHDPETPTAVIASIHQPSSQLYQTFDTILVLAHGHALYTGPGAFAPVDYFAQAGPNVAPAYPQGYNIADYLLEVASDPPLALLSLQRSKSETGSEQRSIGTMGREKTDAIGQVEDARTNEKTVHLAASGTQKATPGKRRWFSAVGIESQTYATTFLTQLECLCGREWKILRRDKTLFLTHVAVAAVLGVFCGGLYFQTGTTIAGFQSRVGCLFFLGALVAFSSLSALYNIVEIRPLFLRERSSSYYSPTTWLLSRFIFDVVPLRIIPTLIVSTITYWMAGLSGDAAHFFKFLFILVLYTLVMTLYNFLLGTFFHNGGIAILLSALSALYQMTFAGFFVHLSTIPPVLRWLQWLCPLKYNLEALSVNEIDGGLMIQDTLSGVPVNVSATLIMQLLFGFGINNYYRDVLILFGFIAGFGLGVIGVVWFRVREQR